MVHEATPNTGFVTHNSRAIALFGNIQKHRELVPLKQLNQGDRSPIGLKACTPYSTFPEYRNPNRFFPTVSVCLVNLARGPDRPRRSTPSPHHRCDALNTSICPN